MSAPAGLRDRIRQHAQPELRRRLLVPEWGAAAEVDASGREIVAAQPLVILYDMVTLDDLAAVHAIDGDEWHKQAPRIVVMKALDESGQRLFPTVVDGVLFLRESAAPDVVNRIAVAMLGRLTVEDAAKN